MRFAILGAAAAIVAAAAATESWAQVRAELGVALRSGIVGERYDGYMGFAASPSRAVRQQVAAVNIRRRTLYLGLASRRGVTQQAAGIATGCQLLARVQVGQSYMLSDGQWRRRLPGKSAPIPDYCR